MKSTSACRGISGNYLIPRGRRNYLIAFRGSDSAFSGNIAVDHIAISISTSTSKEDVSSKFHEKEHNLQARNVISEAFCVAMKCPSCGNPELQEHHCFCYICGFNLAVARSSGTSTVLNTRAEQFPATAGMLQSFSLRSPPRNEGEMRLDMHYKISVLGLNNQ